MPLRRSALALLLCAAAGWAAELKTLKQETVVGDLASLTSKEVVIIKAGGEKATFPTDQVVLLNFGQAVGALPNVPWADVELTDGTLLHCAKFSVVGDQVEATLLSGQAVKFPLASVETMLANAQDEGNRKRWAEITGEKRAHDVLARAKDGVINPGEGTIGKASDDGKTIHFTLASTGKEFDVPLDSVAGMVFDRKPDADAPPVLCKLYDTHRNLVVVSAAESTPAGFAVTTPAGVKIEYTTALVSKMDFSKGKLDFLSDMTPIKVAEKFALVSADVGSHYRRDANLDDRPIRVNNVQYDKGLALHATTELVYDLKGDYREFRCVAGIDDDVKGDERSARPVVLLIEGDGVELAKVTLSRKDKEKAVPITRNVKDVKKLRIVVGTAPGDPNDMGLHLDLANAQVSK
jgi:hypothetical protein